MRRTFLQIYIFTLILAWSSVSLYATDDICGSELWYGLYECRVENICSEYKSEKPTYRVEDYLPADEMINIVEDPVQQAPEFYNAKWLYRENMWNIYKCAMIQSQKNALEFLSGQFKQESSGHLSDTLEWQMELRMSRLDLSAGKIGCVLTDRETIQNKLNILRETTYEACRYVNYLEYMKIYYSEPGIIAQRLDDKEWWYPLIEIPERIAWIQWEIAEEISYTYKIFPIAYHAYSEYENNFPIHFLLEVIKADFKLVRNRFHETLMPLAQLWYKVINAMSY